MENISLLDYFAGQALSGLMAIRKNDYETVPSECYDMAEAMMRQRTIVSQRMGAAHSGQTDQMARQRFQSNY